MRNLLLIIVISVQFVANAELIKTQWQVEVKSISSKDVMSIFIENKKEKKLLLKYEPQLDADFKQAEEVYITSVKKKFLVTRWRRGAHSETMRIFDPLNKEKPLQYEIITSWPAKYTVQKDRLIIHIPVDVYDASHVPKVVKTQWVPKL